MKLFIFAVAAFASIPAFAKPQPNFKCIYIDEPSNGYWTTSGEEDVMLTRLPGGRYKDSKNFEVLNPVDGGWQTRSYSQNDASGMRFDVFEDGKTGRLYASPTGFSLVFDIFDCVAE